VPARAPAPSRTQGRAARLAAGSASTVRQAALLSQESRFRQTSLFDRPKHCRRGRKRSDAESVQRASEPLCEAVVSFRSGARGLHPAAG
jgi:hypothetical protein